MEIFPTVLVKYEIHPVSKRVELWVRWNDKIDHDQKEELASWVDGHGALVVQTSCNPPQGRQLFLPPLVWRALETNPHAELVLCGADSVVDIQGVVVGSVWA